MTSADIRAIHDGLRRLAGVCDGARQHDDQGFNASHTYRGHQLAASDTLSVTQAREGWDIIQHYRRQLGEDFIKGLEHSIALEDFNSTSDGVSNAGNANIGIQAGVQVARVEPNAPEVIEQMSQSHTSGSGVQLTDEQRSAVDTILAWHSDPLSRQEFRLGGYAGTGKTTVAKAIREALRSKRLHCSFCAFTGKAVNVLQRKGIYEAQTCHSLMYDVEIDPKTGAISFNKKYRLEGNNDVIVVDEASMLSTDLYNDLKSYGIKLLFIGDPGQLEPVGDNPDLMRHPDVTLSKIHRQAEQSPIIRFANNVRLGTRPSVHTDGDLVVRSKTGLTIPALLDLGVDQVICAKNKTRTEVNSKYRLALNKPLDRLEAGDKIIVLRNNAQCGVFNGMILFVDEVLQDDPNPHFGWWKVNCHDEINRKFSGLRVWRKPFVLDLEKDFQIPKFDKVPLVYADWGYCITCHKSQGSEWDHVLVWDEWMPPQVWDMKRWRYTAITRAAKKLTYCL